MTGRTVRRVKASSTPSSATAGHGAGWRPGATLLAVIGLSLAVALTFQHAANGQFLNWDDNINLTTNPHLHPLNAENVWWMLTDLAWMRRYVPLAWLGWGIEQAAFGLDARVAHVGNILFHLANTVLVFVLLRRLLARRAEADPVPSNGRPGLAFLLTLLWALHPLRVEPVAWASGRLYLQAAFFALLAVLAYLQSQRATAARPGLWRAGAVGLFGASLFTYPIALGLPAALLLIDTCITRRLDWLQPRWTTPSHRRVWRDQLPFFVVAGLALALTLWARAKVSGIWAGTAAGNLDATVAVQRILRACWHSLHVLWKPLVPLELSPVYTDLVDPQPWAPQYLVGGLGCVAVTGGLLWLARRDYRPLAIWCGLLLFLVPCLGFTEATHYPSDRYTYLPAILVLAVVGWLLARWPTHRVAPVLLVLAAGLALLSHRQVAFWRTDEVLFRRALAVVGDHPYRGDLTWRLAETLSRTGRKTEAWALYEETLRAPIGPESRAAAHHGLGVLLLERGDEAAALDHWRAAATLAPHMALYHQWCGFILLRAGKTQEAAATVQRGLQFDPDNVELRRYEAGLRQLLGERPKDTR